jgi:hypothetical protein
MNSTLAIHQTIDWYRQAAGNDAAQLVFAQLDKYQDQL